MKKKECSLDRVKWVCRSKERDKLYMLPLEGMGVEAGFLDIPRERNTVEVVECRSSHFGVYRSILELKVDLRWGKVEVVGNVLV